MQLYNKHDVLATEELYRKLIVWDNTIDFNVYHDELHITCNSCGSTELTKYGFRFTNTGKFQRYICSDCGTETKGTVNLLSKEKKQSLKRG